MHPETAGAFSENGQHYKRIEEIETGDIVLAWDEETGQLSYRRVVNTFVRQTDQIYRLGFERGEEIQTTHSHPFYVIRNSGYGGSRTATGEWIEAKHLRVGDRIQTAEGRPVSITGIGIEARTETVYNFEVADEHNYFVGRAGVLVHNTDEDYAAGFLTQVGGWYGDTMLNYFGPVALFKAGSLTYNATAALVNFFSQDAMPEHEFLSMVTALEGLVRVDDEGDFILGREHGEVATLVTETLVGLGVSVASVARIRSLLPAIARAGGLRPFLARYGFRALVQQVPTMIGEPGPGVTAEHIAAAQQLANRTGTTIVIHGSRQTGTSYHTGRAFAAGTDLDLGIVGTADDILRVADDAARLPDVIHPPMSIFESSAEAVGQGYLVINPVLP